MKKIADIPYLTNEDMGNIKPSVNYKGFIRALNDYPENAVAEELAANSYDAYASTFVLLLDESQNKLYCLDDGDGFNDQTIRECLTLGGGNKEYTKAGERVFLGSYGFGFKAVLKLANYVSLSSCSLEDGVKYVSNMDLNMFESKMQPDSEGYTYDTEQLPNSASKGTNIILSLKKLTTKTELDQYAKGLTNLPSHNGNFKCYYGFYSEVKQDILPVLANFNDLKEVARKLTASNKLSLVTNLFDIELDDCETTEIEDKEQRVKAKFFFAGMDGMVPKQLKENLRGVYLRVHGRLLKSDFSNDKYTGKISKYIQFKSGMRTELSIDWLRTEITLSRDGVTFQNEKLESDFKKAVSTMITKFLKPKLDLREKARSKTENIEYKKRMEQASKRISKNSDEIVIKGVKSGFLYKPETDAEVAILISQEAIMNKINPHYKLIDFNTSAPFDCLIYDEASTNFIKTELEPTLMEFLEHREKKGIQLIIVWTRGAWKVGAKKKGKGGYFSLTFPPDSAKGFYKLLEFSTDKSKTPRNHFEVIALNEIFV